MKLSLSTGSLYHFPLSTTFSLVKEVGFDGVELAVSPECVIRGLDYIKKLVARNKLPVLSLHPPMMRMPGWGNSSTILTKSVEWANELGCDVVTFHPAPAISYDTGVWSEYVHCVERCKSLCRDGLKIAIENCFYLPETKQSELCVLDGLPELIDFAASRGFCLTLDTSHAWVTEADVIGPYQGFKDRLANIHFSDVNTRKMPVSNAIIESVMVQHQLPGTGVVPLRELLEKLFTDNYQGLITLEISPLALRAWSVGSARKRLLRGLEFCKEFPREENLPKD